MKNYIQSTWLYYWIWIPIVCAIECKSSLYEVYSELWLINSIKLGKYKQWLGG